MWSGQLKLDFWIFGNITAASEVLEGAYVSPEGLSKSVVDML